MWRSFFVRNGLGRAGNALAASVPQAATWRVDDDIEAEVRNIGQTGVEMEALT
ncbi:cyclic pyranopterin monophosphate synthase MoaC [Candidatus Entotheonella palauensis]|uniref:cyclic pyranopterin monophosphate synthase MoaC n=1 Tax=Candidatus Entotheonella palauensis TaxID=93172 RepID=UPI0011788167|nr:cyclic pyranopterin monophosphate synthase MoaC [Candidatus Entotheonella palauensis]